MLFDIVLIKNFSVYAENVSWLLNTMLYKNLLADQLFIVSQSLWSTKMIQMIQSFINYIGCVCQNQSNFYMSYWNGCRRI